MTTATLTLTDFLLARIAEDEAPTYEVVPYACDPGCCAPAGWVGHRCLLCGTPAEYGGTVQAITEICREHEEQIHQRSYVLADCKSKRRIVEFHKNWPVLVQAPPTFETVPGDDPLRITYRASQQIAWTTEQEYRNRFGDEPPTAPMLAAMAEVYADHEDYREAWRP